VLKNVADEDGSDRGIRQRYLPNVCLNYIVAAFTSLGVDVEAELAATVRRYPEKAAKHSAIRAAHHQQGFAHLVAIRVRLPPFPTFLSGIEGNNGGLPGHNGPEGHSGQVHFLLPSAGGPFFLNQNCTVSVVHPINAPRRTLVPEASRTPPVSGEAIAFFTVTRVKAAHPTVRKRRMKL
jgi:hypothetical protein